MPNVMMEAKHKTPPLKKRYSINIGEMSLVPNAYDIPNKLEKTIIPKIVFMAFH